MNVCRLCESDNVKIIHKGTRDRADIDVMKCSHCGLVFLSKIETDDNFYTSGDMRKGIDFAKWRQITYGDDIRRFDYFLDRIKEKSILDFGCGNGGFLAMAKDVGIVKVVGVEHDKAACKCLIRSGIECYEDITDAPPPGDIRLRFYVSCNRAFTRARENLARSKEAYEFGEHTCY